MARSNRRCDLLGAPSSSYCSSRTSIAAAASVAVLALGASRPMGGLPSIAAVDAFVPAAATAPFLPLSTTIVRRRTAFVAPSSDRRSAVGDNICRARVVRYMSDVGGGVNDRPPSGGGGNGGSGGDGKRPMDDFLGRDGDESENLRDARERIYEESLPISFGFERAGGDEEGADEVAEEEEEEEEGTNGLKKDGDDDDTSSEKGGDLDLYKPNDPATTALDLKDNPYLEVVSRLSPSELISKFTTTAHPRVQDAVRSTILGLIGNLPKMAFDTTTVTTGERLASLMFQLQMTGYMFKNAEYRLSLTQSLGMDHMPSIKGMAKDGYLLEGTLSPHEEDDDDDELSPVKLDGKVRGKIKVKYSGSSSGKVDADDEADDEADGDADGPAPSNAGNGLEIEVDAAAYMSELRSEVSRLKEELATTRKTKDDAVKKDLLLYIRTMPREELKQLTGTMSPDVLAAMKGLVNVVMAGIGEGRIEADTVTEQSGEAMAQLCMWQLVVGYNLRELEVREEMRSALGKFGGGEDDDGRVWLGEGH